MIDLRERIARIIDPDAWHETLPQDGLGVYWISRRNKAREKSDAVLADLRKDAVVVAWMYDDGEGFRHVQLDRAPKGAFPFYTETPLYAHPPVPPVQSGEAERALNGYRAAVSYISADSWDGCSDCIEILRAAQTADHTWAWAADTNRVAEELKALRPFCNHEPRAVHPQPDQGEDIERFAAALEAGDFDSVRFALNQAMCCSGYECGCQGSSVGQYLAYELRAVCNASKEGENNDAR